MASASTRSTTRTKRTGLPLVWSVRELTTTKELVAEGKARMENGRAVLSGVGAEGSLLSPGSASEAVDIESLARMTP